MYDYLLSVFLGIVEGLTEFLPVSSTAHLRICEALLHVDLHDGFWKMYTIVIQLGAILALPVYFFVALAVVAWFMNWVRARGFTPFAVYRIVLGIVLLLLLARGVL